MKQLIVIAVFFWSVGLVNAQQVTFSPSIIRASLEPGKSYSKTIRITNLSPTKQSFQASFGDWERDSLGGHKYYEPKTKPWSCAGWCSVTPSFFEIEPQQSIDLLLTMQGPTDTTLFNTSRWAMLFVKGTVEKTEPFVPEKKLATTIREYFRAGIHVYQTPPAVKLTKAALQNITVPKVNPEKVLCEMQNTGKTFIEVKNYLELTNIETGREYKVKADPFPMFPGAKRNTELAIPKDLPKGKYSLLAIVDYGDSYPLEAIEKTIEIK